MEKRIKEYKINKITKEDDYVYLDIDFTLAHKQKFTVLGRVFTIKNINLCYNSKKNVVPKITINTLKGPSLEGFNLKNKHLNEINEILTDLIKVGVKL